MATCENCGLRIKVQRNGNEVSLCDPCKGLARDVPEVRVSPISRSDLELILAWRSHPDIYRHFRNQTEPLTWSDHLSWFNSRDPSQQDFIIHYDGRRVGVVGLNTNDEITIYIGDFSARNKGTATSVINWLKERFNARTPLIAEVNERNASSKQLFLSCGFREEARSDGWITFVYNC